MDLKQKLASLFAGSAIKQEDMIRSCRAVLGSLPLVANALVAESGKSVTIKRGRSGSLGATDGKTIYLMDLPIPSKRTDVETFVNMLALGYGLVHHEIGHVNYSTFPLPEAVRHDPLLKHILNTIEDVRQENVHIQACPGARPYLDSLNAVMQLTGHLGQVTKEDPPVQVLTGYLLYKLYLDYRHDTTVMELALDAEKVFKETFPAGVVARMEAMLPRMDDLTSSDDAYRLAVDIRQMLQEEADKEEQQTQDSDGERDADHESARASANADQDADNTDADQTETGEEDEKSEEPDEGDSDDEDHGSTEQDDTSSDDSDDPSTSSASQDATDNTDGQSPGEKAAGSGSPLDEQTENLKSALAGDHADSAFGDHESMAEEALSEVTNQIRENGDEESLEMTGAHLDTAVDDSSALDSLGTGYYNMQQALSVSGPLRRKLTREMQAIVDDDVFVGRRGRKIATRHLARVGCGDSRIFRAKDDGMEVHTAVCLALDVSCSMNEEYANGTAISTAAQALYATTKAMEAIDGVTVAATCFPGFGVIKPFGRRSRLVEDHFHLAASGYDTPMGHGITMATRMLEATQESRKILMVITDGEPNSRAKTSLATEAALARGMEVFGLGIMSNAGENLFPHWVMLTDISALPTTLIGLLRGRLLAQAA